VKRECADCGGTGEGYAPGALCPVCGGRGYTIEKPDNDQWRERAEDYTQRYIDAGHTVDDKEEGQ
jgi:RecJ-like exonuclease